MFSLHKGIFSFLKIVKFAYKDYSGSSWKGGRTRNFLPMEVPGMAEKTGTSF